MSRSDPLFLDINTIGRCVDYLEEMQDGCGVWEKQAGHTVSEARARVRHCTTDIVKTWRPPANGDGCTRWKAAAKYYTNCDPAIFSWPPTAARCVDDDQVAEMTGGRFISVDECADYLYSNAYPCEIPIGSDRVLCVNLSVEESE